MTKPARSDQAASKPLTAKQIQGLVAGGVDSRRLALLVDARGIDFVPSARFLNDLKASGVSGVLIQALTAASATRNAPAKQLQGSSGTPAQTGIGGTTGSASEVPVQSGGSSRLSLAVQRGLEQDMARGAEFNRIQSWQRAEDIYRSTLRVDPSIPAARMGLAKALMGEKEWDEAVSEYRQVLRLDPRNQIAHRELARAFTEKRDWDNAIGEYKLALEIEPIDPELQVRYGDAFYAKGDLGKAIAAYQAAQKLKPEDIAIEKSLALALFTSGDVDGALAAFRQAAQIDPNDPELHKRIGDALLGKGDRRGALEEYHRAFELAPDNSTMGASYAAILTRLRSDAGSNPSGGPSPKNP